MTPLTSREQEVHDLLIEGYTDNQIASALCISPGTVKSHARVVLAKTGHTDRKDLAIHYWRSKYEELLNQRRAA